MLSLCVPVTLLTLRLPGSKDPRYHRGDYAAFVGGFSAAFDHPDLGQSSGQRLLWPGQEDNSVADYSICVLAADSGWNQPTLLQHFQHGLCPELQKELVCRDAYLDLTSMISLVIRLDQHLQAQ